MTDIRKAVGSEAVAQLRAELEAHRAELAPVAEGMRDYERVGNGVDGEKPMREAAAAAASTYERRLALVERALGALHDLDAAGYPEIPPHAVPAEILTQLEHNQATITAALGRFALQPEPAIDGFVTFGTGVLKPASSREDTRGPGTGN